MLESKIGLHKNMINRIYQREKKEVILQP